MARPKNLTPTYKHHKPTNTARCWVNGSWVSLGKYNSPESRQTHARLCLELSTSPTPSLVRTTSPSGPALSVNELIKAYVIMTEKKRRTSVVRG
jgi:hypothetical protein